MKILVGMRSRKERMIICSQGVRNNGSAGYLDSNDKRAV